MTVSDAIASRRSVRAFLDTPVDRAVLERVLGKARRAPSGGNLQPWNCIVSTGEPLRRVFAAVRAQMAAGVTEPEHAAYPPALPEPYRSRRYAVGEGLYASLGIGQEDKPGRMRQMARNFEAFGAPVCLFTYTPTFMGRRQWADLGIWLQTVMLLLREEGLDSCAQGAWAQHGPAVRGALGISDDYFLFCGLAIGRADPDAPINRFPIDHAPLEETVRWDGFAG